MTKSLFYALLLSTSFMTACASTPQEEQFAADDCKALSSLFRDQNLNGALMHSQTQSEFEAQASKDKFTWPWGRGARDADRVSKERAALRQAHNRKGCAN